jgi:2-oxoisovalerate dehydrogenase E2 component (dihydrolipoyl transacylase)
MAERIIKIPDIGEGIAEVELVAWHVKPGDVVAEDQGLADVMTDKATVEVPSPVNGKVVALGGEVGQLMAVGSELIRIETDADVAVTPSPSGGAQGRGQAVPKKAATPPPPPPPPSQPSPAGGRSQTERPIASPSVRRRAWELGIDLAQVSASGTAGRIMHADLDALAAKGAKPSTSPGRTGGSASRAGVDERIPVVGLRRRIAQKMQEAKRRIPHFTYVEEIDMTELEALRARLNAQERGVRLTVLPFLIRAITLAVRDFPQINAHFDDEAGVVTRHGAVHMGIATQTESGLMVPVVRDAHSLDLWQSAAEVARVSQAARNGKATRDELTGSTITLTSLGALGGIVSTPIINQPEVAIVGVNRIVSRPAIHGGHMVPRQLMNLSSSFDHRVIDGQVAAQFIQSIRGMLESPALLFIEKDD